MGAALKQEARSDSSSTPGRGEKSLIERFGSRSTKELIIAFAGPIGSGIQKIVEDTKQRLLERGYVDVVEVKLSKFIQEAATTGLVIAPSLENESSPKYQRYRGLQESGRLLREATGNRAILAEYAMREIAIDRRRRDRQAGGEEGSAVIVPGRVAYLIDQVKRPEEVALFRAVYRNAFYLIGVTRVYDRRVAALRQEDIRVDEIHKLMEIDRLETADDGQKIDKTLHLSDFFVRNDSTTVEDRAIKINRVLDLIHGDRSITPTDAEQGMYAAYSAGLRSACLSRQVGAAIANVAGEVIATGCNDVPKFGGGLYTASSGKFDMRCIHREEQHCFNDFYKRKLQEDIGVQVESYLGKLVRESPGKGISLSEEERAGLIDVLYEKTRLRDLIEFSRSVHAEMDAIVSVARHGTDGLIGSTLYTTTFPCHSCARHIVAAGISKVFYIEPYEKSMARDLHGDAIAFDVEDRTDQENSKAQFLHFEGVSPRQFHNFFRAPSRKDDAGKVIRVVPRNAEKVIPEYLDNYQDFETKAVEHLDKEIEDIKGNRPSAIAIDKAMQRGNNNSSKEGGE